ncbi:OmpP1/FadL family transporter [Amantichitinum ursilacus]|uniref:Putative outer membrane protein n=1 Tax=Amantichitinum ursilacus TaxID=857265 RepID=A0A0N1JTH8_9NEIS|nr:OmpP1/FadL family transporter [Amantichitinum ursilacus]KPC54788.1 putative outer membrane protein precursor [Amantichitinum ursilacus]
MKKIASALRLVGASTLVFVSGHALASGYSFGVQSVSSQSVANSNGAEAKDASVLFYNPAGMTHLKGDNFSGALVILDPSVSPSNISATTAGGASVSGNDGGRATSIVEVPQLYYTHQFNDQVYGGIGFFIPFGDAVSYDEGWIGRYNSTKLDMRTYAFNPAFAYKVNDHLSIGFGITAQYMDAKFNKKADFGSLAAQELQTELSSTAGQAALTNLVTQLVVNGQLTTAQAAQLQASLPSAIASMQGNPADDSEMKYQGTDWGFGWNVGVMYDVDETLRFGAAYRSHIKHNLSGDANWYNPNSITIPGLSNLGTAGTILNQALQNQLSGAFSAFTNSSGTVAVDTPDTASINFFKQVTPQWAVMADWTHTWHSKFDELQLDFSNSLPNAVIVQNWKNTNRFSVGTTYQYSQPLQLRAGIAYDQSPVPSSEYRLAALPDNNRTWFSLGLNYMFTPQLSLDLAYTYVKIQDAHMNNNEGCLLPACTGSGTTTVADFDSNANILGMQVNYKF